MCFYDFMAYIGNIILAVPAAIVALVVYGLLGLLARKLHEKEKRIIAIATFLVAFLVTYIVLAFAPPGGPQEITIITAGPSR